MYFVLFREKTVGASLQGQNTEPVSELQAESSVSFAGGPPLWDKESADEFLLERHLKLGGTADSNSP